MKEKIEAFKKLSFIFSNNGYNLYLVGGTVRDFLLNRELTDMDITTDATPDEIKTFFKGEANYTFSKYGAVSIKYDGVKFDLTTLRREKNYLDFRHPNAIVFVREPKNDYKRRDFTINGMYLDSRFRLIDYVDGEKDLREKTIKMIGSPNKRLKEDPLRILRAIRFALTFSFKIDESLKKAMHKNIKLIKNLNPQKVIQELKKIGPCDENMKISLFNEFDILYLLDMVK